MASGLGCLLGDNEGVGMLTSRCGDSDIPAVLVLFPQLRRLVTLELEGSSDGVSGILVEDESTRSTLELPGGDLDVDGCLPLISIASTYVLELDMGAESAGYFGPTKFDRMNNFRFTYVLQQCIFMSCKELTNHTSLSTSQPNWNQIQPKGISPKLKHTLLKPAEQRWPFLPQDFGISGENRYEHGLGFRMC